MYDLDHSPGYNTTLDFETLTPEQYLVLTIEAARKLNWTTGLISKQGFIAYRKEPVGQLNEELSVQIREKKVRLESRITNLGIQRGSRSEENINALIATLRDLQKTMKPGELSLKFEEIKANLVPVNLSQMGQPPSTVKEDINDFAAFFKTSEGYYFTPVLIVLNLAIFILMGFSSTSITNPDGEILLRWGALFTPLVLEGEWWRLVTCCFLHTGIVHLLVNMYALMYIGKLLEPLLGKTRFIAAYLFSGIFASASSLWWHEVILGAGSSGAIFGLYGVLLALLTTNRIDLKIRKSLLPSIGLFVFINLIGGLALRADFAAHIGGLVGGILFGYACLPALKTSDSEF